MGSVSQQPTIERRWSSNEIIRYRPLLIVMETNHAAGCHGVRRSGKFVAPGQWCSWALTQAVNGYKKSGLPAMIRVVNYPVHKGKEAAAMKIVESAQRCNPEQIASNMNSIVDQLKDCVESAATAGESFDSVERKTLKSVLQIGHQALELLLALQGDGDLGEPWGNHANALWLWCSHSSDSGHKAVARSRIHAATNVSEFFKVMALFLLR